MNKLTFSEGWYSGILTSERILVTASSERSWEGRKKNAVSLFALSVCVYVFVH